MAAVTPLFFRKGASVPPMDIAILLIKQTLIVLIDVLSLAMLVRAILSWIDQMGEFRISAFLFMITEPVILPVRKLCAKLHLFEGIPLDIPYMITIILLYLLQMMLMM